MKKFCCSCNRSCQKVKIPVKRDQEKDAYKTSLKEQICKVPGIFSSSLSKIIFSVLLQMLLSASEIMLA